MIVYPSTFVARQVGSAYPGRFAAKRGMLFVPENRANPQSDLIVIGFWLIPSTSPSPRAPIVYLQGGPGHANIDTWKDPPRFRRIEHMLKVADVILFDQRGSGSPSESLPSLHCPNPFTFPLMEPWVDVEQVRNDLSAGVRECAAFFQASGRDLRGYSFKESADDLEDLRRALGYAKLNVWGYSAGSSLARMFAHRHPTSIERLAFGGVATSDIDRGAYAAAFRMLQDGDPSVGITSNPKLGADLSAVLARLDATPVDVDTVAPDGSALRIRLGPYDVLHQLGWATTELPVAKWQELATTVHEMARGDFRWVAAQAAVWRLGQHRSLTEGKLAGLIEQCVFRGEHIPTSPRSKDIFDRFEDFTTSFPCTRALSQYTEPPIEPDRWPPYKGDTLIYNGERDVQTGLAGALEELKRYPNSTLIIFEGKSHHMDQKSTDGVEPELREVMNFFAGAKVSPGRIVRLPN